MPNIDPSVMLPFAPLHWTSILHYILLLGTLFILVSSQSDVSLIFIFILGLLALVTGADLYANLLGMPRFVIFMLRTAMFGLPMLLGGLSPSESTRGVAIIIGLVAGLPLFAVIFLTCMIPFLADPRLVYWCR